MWLILQVTLLLPVIITAMPGGIAKSAAISANFDSGAPLFTFDKGNVGVNFLGYRASAGLGGLLTGNSADGGLHASAGTPHGQSAGAGLGGGVDANGNAVGYKYHYANDSRLNFLNLLPFIGRPQIRTTQKPSEVETLE